MASLYKIAEQVQAITGKGNLQAIIESVKNVYASQCKLSWFENKAEGINEVNGIFVYTFKNISPELDCDLNLFYIDVPSSYLNLPNEMGVNQVSFMKGQNRAFVRVGSSSWGMWTNLKSGLLGNNQIYFMEQAISEPNSKIYFPNMDENNKGNILLKLTVAVDTTDVEAEINIPPNIVDNIVNAIIVKYASKVDPVPDNLK